MGSKSSFSKTCNLLSQYLKDQKRSVGDLNLAAIPDSAVDSKGTRNSNNATVVTSTMNLFPQESGFYDETTITTKSSSSTAAAASQMTIFYNGQVIVYNDITTDKVKEIIELASKGSAPLKSTVVVDPAAMMTLPSPAVHNNVSAPILPSRIQVSDLPIMRKASLHRFFEKRKDRLSAKAPYSMNNQASQSKGSFDQNSAATPPWLGLAPRPELQS